MVATTVSDGTTVTSNVLLKLQADAGESRLAQLSARQQPWGDWFEMVPADATGFYFDSGIDPAALFDLIAGLVQENVDHGDQLVAAGAGLREVLAQFSGEMASVSFPSQGATGCPLGECVCFVRLEKTDGVSDWLSASLDGCARYLISRGQHMEVESSGGMYEIRLAAFPWIRPVIGVRGNHLICATSAAAVAKIARVQNGQEANIRSSERFTRLGVGREDAVDYLHYAQVDESTEDFANLVSAAGFFLSVLPEDKKTRAAIKLGAILTKLSPALRELDIRYDWASELASWSEDAVKLRTVIRYR